MCVELDGFLLLKSVLCVVVDWSEQFGRGYVRAKGEPNGALLKREALQQAGFDTTAFGDVLVADIANRDGVRVLVNIRAATDEDLKQ
jgi:hypothetical protein